MTREDWIEAFAEFARIPGGLPEPEALAREIVLCTGGMPVEQVRQFAYALFDNLIRAVHALEEIEVPASRSGFLQRGYTNTSQSINEALRALEKL